MTSGHISLKQPGLRLPPHSSEATSSSKLTAASMRLLPLYAACCRCGETASEALRQLDTSKDSIGIESSEDGRDDTNVASVVCLNCLEMARESSSRPRRRCTTCAKVRPSELHHVASRQAYPNFVTPLCCNCHAVLYSRQYAWRRDESAEQHPWRFMLVGVADIVCLFMERSPAWIACRQLLMLLAHAATLSLGALCHPSLLDVGQALEVLGASFTEGI